MHETTSPTQAPEPVDTDHVDFEAMARARALWAAPRSVWTPAPMTEMERELVARGHVPFYDEQGNLMGWGAPWPQPRPLPSATVAAWTAYTVGVLGFMALAAVLINGWPA